MPYAPPRPCPICGRAARGGRCAEHAAADVRSWPTRPTVVRLRGPKLQAARRRLFARHPLCEPCEQRGRVTLATIRDHRRPLAEGGDESIANEQAICYACHVAKTHAESRRGKVRQAR